MSGRLAIGALGLIVASCATPQGEALVPHLQPIVLALAEDPSNLEARAEAGSAQHQLALSVIYAHGLRGRPRNGDLANAWAGRAASRRGWMPITTYTPAFNGKSSRVGMIQVPRYDLTSFDIGVVQRCARALELADPAGAAACGGAAEHARLGSLWRAAASAEHE